MEAHNGGHSRLGIRAKLMLSLAGLSVLLVFGGAAAAGITVLLFNPNANIQSDPSGLSTQLVDQGLLVRSLPYILVILLAGFLISFLIASRFGQPIRSLALIARMIATGKYQLPIPVTRDDEIGDLEGAIESLRYQLHSATWEIEKKIAERMQNEYVLTEKILPNPGAEVHPGLVPGVQVAADIIQAVAVLTDFNEFLGQVVQMTAQKFGFDHASIFLLDEPGEYAVLKASSSQIGQELLKNGYRLKVGQQGIVGNVAGTGEVYVAPDVSQDPVYSPTDHLPGTVSEIALPLISWGKLIGVLDIQNSVQAAFNAEIIEALKLLANQIAALAVNAELAQELKDRDEEINRLSPSIVKDEWAGSIASLRLPAYEYDQLQVSAVESRSLLPETAARLQAGQMVVFDAIEDDGQAVSRLLAPLRLFDETIGVVGFEKDGSGSRWTDEEKIMVESICGQVAMAMENARLFDEAQRRAASEHLISQVTARIRETLHVDSVLQTAAYEIRESMNLKDVTIRLGEG